MGLICSHNAWNGPYTKFAKWRKMLAHAAGLPPLELMEGFYKPLSSLPPTLPDRNMSDLNERLPIPWTSLKSTPLLELLRHSDCDGEIPAKRCKPIADALARLQPVIPLPWRETTARFIGGLRAAALAGEPLQFR